MGPDKAYLLGLIIGGGEFGNNEDVFKIILPYKKWGSYIYNKDRAEELQNDIMRQVGNMFQPIYGLNIQFSASNYIWTILCDGDKTSLINDLKKYKINPVGKLSDSADISEIINNFNNNENLKRRFVAGLADTIGSVSPSHRRFNSNHQIISFEISGFNYKLICSICHLLYEIKCYPSQINWNHPNIHCTENAYYSSWNKGFKIRILLDQFQCYGALSFKTKKESLNENIRLQQNHFIEKKCEDKDLNVKPATVHPAENDIHLPKQIKGGHFVHACQICAALGCIHAPKIKLNFIRNPLELGKFVIPFTLLTKESACFIENLIKKDKLMSARQYNIFQIRLLDFKCILSLINKQLNLHQNDFKNLNSLSANKLKVNVSGYPINNILRGLAYIIADQNELRGKRTKGKYINLLESHILRDPNSFIELRLPDLLTPLILVHNDRAAMIGPFNPKVYAKLIIFDSTNEYKFSVRNIKEEDLLN